MPPQTPAVQAIDSPYNFVPLATKVVQPRWAGLVSHDLPFEQGVSGSIRYTLCAESPLLVGGVQTKNTDESTTVAFFRTPAGEVAIPGSSLKGMIRAVLEIASFSRMAQVDDKRYGLRDISGRFVADSYAGRVRNRVQYGLMQLAGGEPVITPCDMARFNHRDVETWWSAKKPVFHARTTVRDKYQVWSRLCEKRGIDPFSVPFQWHGDSVSGLGIGASSGFPVLTGQINDSTMERPDRRGKVTRGKHHDFIFHSPRADDAFEVHHADPNAWRDFLFIHGDEDGKPDMSWPGFWKERYWRQQPVPVFYIHDSDRLQIGLAFMPKLAGDFSIHDMIGHSEKQHLDESCADFATLMFGRVGKTAQDGLRGRVQFELATPVGEVTEDPQPAAILSSPKPTYFPNYIVQDAKGPGWKLAGDNPQYATYLRTQDSTEPKIRGWKRYPTRPAPEIEVQQPNGPDQQRNTKIQLHLRPVARGSLFSGRVHFQNLQPEELGALLWSLRLGGGGALHSLGMGKPFGFGQVRLDFGDADVEVMPNNPKAEPMMLTEYEARFRAYMDEALDADWVETTQIRNLTLMANPEHRDRFPGKLKHMMLEKGGPNEFTDAKQAALTLAPYSVGSGGGRTKKPTKAEWLAAALKFEAGSKTLNAYHDGQTAFVSGADAQPILDQLSKSKLKKLKQGDLKAKVTVEHIGGKNWRILALES
ncbi:TIGR03986 family CRISPR-associated RAMP protein [Thiohalocapsa sp. ML1]|jgi:CRISPR-associated protein (TIGR03986 family)|uniref:TIGR03986 family type III CRISPR-associated RAMP protein n=1 Tax=Thiohalocapsa sp. ML1 TaxID=1431688 RepID=UPI0009EA046E|nr:TIGR03986 family CRISPR-associated RAMP protein [Thiohalocapsa sp. ML1]